MKTKFFNLILFCVIITQVSAQFSSRKYIDRSVNEIRILETADVNLDGKPDLIVGGESGAGWMLNQGSGAEIAFSTQKLSTDGITSYYSSIKIADMNADGWPDMVASSEFSDKVYYFENRGNGFPDDGVLIDGTGDQPIGVALGDVDMDGDMDIIAALHGDGQIKIYRNDNNNPGSFGSGEVLSGTGGNLQDLHLFDADEDGDLDILSGSNVGLIKYQINDGNANFSGNALIGSFNTAYKGLRLVDLDLDGDQDVVAYFDENNNPVVWVENMGLGVWASSVELVTGQPGFSDFQVIDIDNDNLPDLAGLTQSGGELFWYKNNGNQTFAPPQQIETSQSTSDCFTFGNFNEDGLADLVNSDDFKMYYSINEGLGNFSPETPFFSGAITNIDITQGDIDGDGLGDMVVASRDSDNFSWFKNLGNGNFGDQMIIAVADQPRSVHTADLDNDGDVDILTASLGIGTAIHENLGTGQFAPPVIINTGTKFAVSADLDGDGDEDLITGEQVRIWNNEGDLNFSFGPLPSAAFATFIKVIPTDIDLDGDLDIVGAELDNNRVSWLENNGNLEFLFQLIDEDFDSPFDAVPHDFNQDGFPDLLVTSRDDDKISRFMNNGNKTFQAEEILFTGINYPRISIVADLDNDGDGEILTNAFSEARIIYWGNLGDGTFGDMEILDDSLSPFKTFPFDVDADGDLDLINGGTGAALRWYENLTFNIGSNIVQGGVFYDENENGIKEASEKLLQNFPIKVNPEALETYSNTNNISNFRAFLDIGDYTISPDLGSCWELTTSPPQYDVSITVNSPPIQDLQFGVKPISDEQDTKVSLIAAAPTRCGFIVPYYLSVVNEGCSIIDGKFGFLPGDLASLVQAVPAADVIENDTLFWNYTNLYPGESKKIYLEFTIAGPDAIGEIIEMPAVAYLESSPGNLMHSDQYTHFSEIRCAYDPNDKQVVPARSIEGLYNQNFTLFSEALNYMVRFQNTGNDTAFTVVIRDFLSADLDWSTFEPGAASHEYRAMLDSDGLATFTFDHILLPDSSTNEIASHGFVSFNIMAKQDLPDLTTINNSAGIYFDYNPPILTNSVENIMVDPLPSAVIPDFSYLPNALTLSFQDETQNNPTSWLWEFGDGVSSTFQHPNHTFNEPGVYKVCLTAANLVSTDSICNSIAVLATGVRELLLKKGYRIIPNPATGNTSLVFNEEIEEATTLLLFDASGKELNVPFQVLENRIDFDVSGLVPGLVFFKTQDNRGNLNSGKFIIE